MLFCLSLRLLITRRGRPRVIYSDNSANFRDADNDLSKIDCVKMTRSPMWSETFGNSILLQLPSEKRLIRVILKLLRRTFGKAIVTLEELQTILSDWEATINSRPLTHQSENSEDIVTQISSMFSAQNSNLNITDTEKGDANQFPRKDYIYKVENALTNSL